MGLSEYGDLGKAEIFTNSGMSVFNLFESTVRTKSGKKQDLEEVLFQQQYHTIYLMLGINELGYDYSSIIRKYQSGTWREYRTEPLSADGTASWRT